MDNNHTIYKYVYTCLHTRKAAIGLQGIKTELEPAAFWTRPYFTLPLSPFFTLASFLPDLMRFSAIESDFSTSSSSDSDSESDSYSGSSSSGSSGSSDRSSSSRSIARRARHKAFLQRQKVPAAAKNAAHKLPDGFVVIPLAPWRELLYFVIKSSLRAGRYAIRYIWKKILPGLLSLSARGATRLWRRAARIPWTDALGDFVLCVDEHLRCFARGVKSHLPELPAFLKFFARRRTPRRRETFAPPPPQPSKPPPQPSKPPPRPSKPRPVRSPVKIVIPHRPVLRWCTLVKLDELKAEEKRMKFNEWVYDVQHAHDQESDTDDEDEVEEMLNEPGDMASVNDTEMDDIEKYRRSLSEEPDVLSTERDRRLAAASLRITRDHSRFHPYNYQRATRPRREIIRLTHREGPLVTGLGEYELKWREIEDGLRASLNFASIPWPILRMKTPPTVEHITKERVMAFMLYSMFEPYTHCLYKNPDLLRATIRYDLLNRWGSEKFNKLVLFRIANVAEAEEVRAAVEVVRKTFVEMTTTEFWEYISKKELRGVEHILQVCAECGMAPFKFK
ncbi:hypothetical protein A7U60_g407 [Sanghuangporus baumii]|uniref:Uncharacterized protein n=1 Tax=Sanghuangporus baumii TaxID=108892 RepID=A0A9Q5I6J3_SANBA|nr:hypothetical protein A7U60_g407 [Sanghuangporus baumii]